MIRGALRERGSLWPDGVVYYTFHKTVSRKKKVNIRKAMATIESLTCLKFKQRNNEDSFIIFSEREKDNCVSYVGRIGRKQNIQLGPGCDDQGTILHEICHALGMWHEQSRPDRDEYVRVLTDNVKEGLLHNFMKRNIFDVDSLGTPYDYSSVMHYDLGSFAKEEGLKTLEITDLEEYERQGQPNIGYADTLSKIDVVQLNRLYNCPGSGVPGHLKVKIDKAEKLTSASLEAFAVVTAYDDRRQKVIHMTSRVNIENNSNPEWNEELDFGSRVSWQYIEVGVWGYNPQADEIDGRLIRPEAYSVNPGHHNRLLCNDHDCRTTATFSFTLMEECLCYNGGSCKMEGGCDCPPKYGGEHCKYVRSQLRVHVRNGKMLANRDKSDKKDKSDPFIFVQAFDHYGGSKSLFTKTISDTLNPVWNEWLDFGENEWSWFTVQVWDEDTVYLQWLSYAYTYPLSAHVSKTMVKMKGFKGYIYFDYIFEP